MLRTLFPALVLTLAACELQPAPAPSKAPPTPTPAPAPAPAPVPPPTPAAAPADAGVPRVEPTAECTDVGVHVAKVLIAEAPPAQQMSFEQNRDKIIRSTAEVCTTQKWSPEAIKCYAAGNDGTALRACEAKFRQAPAPDATLPRGGQPAFDSAGSAAGSAAPGLKAEPVVGGPARPTPRVQKNDSPKK